VWLKEALIELKNAEEAKDRHAIGRSKNGGTGRKSYDTLLRKNIILTVFQNVRLDVIEALCLINEAIEKEPCLHYKIKVPDKARRFWEGIRPFTVTQLKTFDRKDPTFNRAIHKARGKNKLLFIRQTDLTMKFIDMLAENIKDLMSTDLTAEKRDMMITLHEKYTAAKLKVLDIEKRATEVMESRGTQKTRKEMMQTRAKILEKQLMELESRQKVFSKMSDDEFQMAIAKQYLVPHNYFTEPTE
jgi:hypothetical protein